jgi:mannose/fructose/N-acetylgalactosamine-specific phosphotransferase system component IIB
MKIQEYDALTKENTVRDATVEEIADINSMAVSSADKKLEEIKLQRNIRLKETDFYALSDVTMSEAMSTYRQALRDIPQDYTTEDEYDLLLAVDEQDNLTHSIWSKP